MTSFFITLPSTSSMEIYPENTQSHFTVQLPHAIDLEGQWEVALSEIHLPRVWNNIDMNSNTLHLRVAIPAREKNVLTFNERSLAGLLKEMKKAVSDNPVYDVKGVNAKSEDSSNKEVDVNLVIIVRQGYRLQFPDFVVREFRWLTDPEGYVSGEQASTTPINKIELDDFLKRIESFQISVERKPEDRIISVRIPPGHYTSPKVLFEVIQVQIQYELMRAFPDDYKKYRLDLVLMKNQKCEVIMAPNISIEFPRNSPGLGSLLGFSENQIGHAFSRVITSDYPIDIKGGVYGFYVYSSIIDDQIVGNKRAPLLRCIPIGDENETRQTYVKVYDNPDFYPLAINRFENIEILICADSGHVVKFITGKTLVKLKFRKI